MTTLIMSPSQERADEDEPTKKRAGEVKKLPRESGWLRLLRLLIAFPLFAVSLAALFPFAVLPVSTQAVVNSRLSLVKAPITGQVGTVKLETGDSVTANQILAAASPGGPGAVTDDSEAQSSRAELEQEAARVGAELTAHEEEKSRYDQMYSQYLQRLSGDLDLQVREAQQAYQSSQLRATSASDDVKRSQDALKDHLISRPMFDQAVEKSDQAQREAEVKSTALHRVQKQLADAKAGFVMDPSMEPSFMNARDNAAAEVDRSREEKAALDRQLEEPVSETPVVSSKPGERTPVVSPVSGVIWARSVATGQSVREGDDLFRIADANSIHVEVWLDRRYGPQLSIGDTALVYLGGLGKELSGRVTSFEGTNRRLLDEQVNAIDLQPVHPDQYHVTIELSPEDRKSIYIGQSAKVLFPGSKHRIRASIYFWLTRL